MTNKENNHPKDLRNRQVMSSEGEHNRDEPVPEPAISPLLSQIQDELQEAGVDPADPKLRRVIATMAAYAGPMPPPELIAGYEAVRQGSADEIFSQFNRQVEHRLEIEKQQATGSEARQNRAQVFSFIVAILSLVASTVLIYDSNSWAVSVAAVLLVTVGVGGPSAATIVARMLSKRPRD